MKNMRKKTGWTILLSIGLTLFLFFVDVKGPLYDISSFTWFLSSVFGGFLLIENLEDRK